MIKIIAQQVKSQIRMGRFDFWLGTAISFMRHSGASRNPADIAKEMTVWLQTVNAAGNTIIRPPIIAGSKPGSRLAPG
jgi:hypothetical protein